MISRCDVNNLNCCALAAEGVCNRFTDTMCAACYNCDFVIEIHSPYLNSELEIIYPYGNFC